MRSRSTTATYTVSLSDGDGRDELAMMAGKIFGRQEGAARGKGGDHVVGDRSLVEGGRPLLRDRLEGLRQRRQLDHVAFRRWAAVEQKMPRSAGVGAELLDLPSPVPGNARRNGESALGVADRRRERAIEGKAAMRRKDCRPGVD